uniref:Uncharacterized protein n=1 Tax=Rhizophora mucronata TaxID=61149 RepID=A0A2P2ND31_RHIMU
MGTVSDQNRQIISQKTIVSIPGNIYDLTIFFLSTRW